MFLFRNLMFALLGLALFLLVVFSALRHGVQDSVAPDFLLWHSLFAVECMVASWFCTLYWLFRAARPFGAVRALGYVAFAAISSPPAGVGLVFIPWLVKKEHLDAAAPGPGPSGSA